MTLQYIIVACLAFPINAFSFSLREEDPWWRFHYINRWFKWGWISQARLWRHYSIIPEQNDWKIPFLAEAGSDSQDKSTGMLRPRIVINCVIVTMGFDKEDLSGYLDLFKTLYFRLSFWVFLYLDLHSCPQTHSTALQESNPASLTHVNKCSSANSWVHLSETAHMPMGYLLAERIRKVGPDVCQPVLLENILSSMWRGEGMHIFIRLLRDPGCESVIVSLWWSQCWAKTLFSSMKNILSRCWSSKLNVVWVILKYFYLGCSWAGFYLQPVLSYSSPLSWHKD